MDENSFDRKHDNCPICRTKRFYSKHCPHNFGEVFEFLKFQRLFSLATGKGSNV